MTHDPIARPDPADFDFELPTALIAQMPLAERDASRLLHVAAAGEVYRELAFAQVGELLRPGDLLALYSDGVTEAANQADEEFGQDRLADLLSRTRENSAEDIVKTVNNALDEWTGAAPPDDDITLVIARR